MSNKKLFMGSRSSRLALTQARLVKGALEKACSGLFIEIKTITTTGDKILDVALNKAGDKGLFTKEIEEALLKKEIDLAVHSMKDLPIELPHGLEIGAITARENPRDVLISNGGFTLKTIPEGYRVGTSSLRRRAQLLRLRKDLKVMDLRGNLDTRLKKLREGMYDAVILACAGIERLGTSALLSAGLELKMLPISTEDMIPQAGQGALGIEIREGDREIHDLVKTMDDFQSHAAIEAERALIGALGGGCHAPIGAYADINKDVLRLRGGVFSLDGKIAIKNEISGETKDARELGISLAETLLKKGAKDVLGAIKYD